MKVWLNGELVDRDDAKLTVFDHGVLYGDGVFEGIRIYSGKVFQCQAHVDRLYQSAGKIRLTIPYTKHELVDAMYQTLTANGLADGYIRLVVTRGVGTLGLGPDRCPSPSVFLIADQIALYPKEMYERGLEVLVASTVRTSRRMLDPAVKSLNYLNNIMAKIEALDAGVFEAIMLNEDGNVCECTGDNLFIVKDRVAVTPPPEAGILLGITRDVVIRLAGQLDIACEEKTVSVGALFAADECFLTGTAAEVIPVTKINGRPIGDGQPGPVTKRLHAAFHEFIRSDQA